MFLPISLRFRPDSPRWKSRPVALVLATMALAASLTPATLAQEKEQKPEAPITIEAPAGLMEVARKSQAALLCVLPQTGDDVTLHTGFFIDGDGLALCALDPLLRKPVPGFLTGPGEQAKLGKPAVLGVFPEQQLALVKFKHKPAATLPLAKGPAAIGTWVAVVPSAVAKGAAPVTGPILSRRIGWVPPLTPSLAPLKHFSIATGRNLSYQRVLLPGAPVINVRGEVVAAFLSSEPMPGQLLRFATPIDGLQSKIADMVKRNQRLTIPLTAADVPFEAVVFDEKYPPSGELESEQDLASARVAARKLAEKYPDCLVPRIREFNYAVRQSHAGQGNRDELVPLAERTKPPEDASPSQQSLYFDRLGTALAYSDRSDEALQALQKSETLDIDSTACMTLAVLHEKRGELEQAEAAARKATTLNADRIELWDRYSKVLLTRGKTKEANEAQERAYLLEDLYRSR